MDRLAGDRSACPAFALYLTFQLRSAIRPSYRQPRQRQRQRQHELVNDYVIARNHDLHLAGDPVAADGGRRREANGSRALVERALAAQVRGGGFLLEVMLTFKTNDRGHAKSFVPSAGKASLVVGVLTSKQSRQELWRRLP